MDDHDPLAELVVPADATLAARHATEEFRAVYARATDTELPIHAQPTASTNRVFVGAAAADLPTAPSLATDDLEEEDCRYVVADGDVAIAGGGQRGTLYAVYEFLEDRLGARFLAPEHTYVPDDAVTDDLLAPAEYTYRPPLEFRYSYYGVVQNDPTYAARVRNNTVTDEPELGGRTSMRLINHSVSRWVNTDEHGHEHPEYFALVDGERRNDVDSDAYGTQPCPTEPAVRELILEGVLDELAAEPERTNISVGQNDNTYYCRCPDCQAIIDRERSPMGPHLDLVNEVADVVAEEHPGVKVGTLAYQYTRTPPAEMEPRENVQIQLCSIEACILHPIEDPECEQNVDFCADLAAWNELTDQIYIWNYNTNFRNYLQPCPNLRVIGPNVRYFVDNGAKGIFMQAAGRGARATEFDHLRNYLMSTLLWDPTRDEEDILDEFLELHYQEAAPPIREWLERLHDHVAERDVHNNCFGQLADYGITDELVAEGERLFEEALDRAESEAVSDRVERASLCIHRAKMEPAVLAMRDRGPWDEELAAAQLPIVERFYELADAYGVNIPVEWTDTEAEKERMRELFDLDETAFA